LRDRLERLSAEARARVPGNLRPVDAATLILLDDSSPSPRILMGRRNAALTFMPGKFVFPGGRVDAADRTVAAADDLSPEARARLAARVARPSERRSRALALAAIRETYEETGYLLGRKGLAAAPLPASWRAFEDEGLLPAPGALAFVARAITPPRRPRRFDTRFFLARLSDAAARVERDIGPHAELTELAWVTLDEAMLLDTPTITQVMVQELRDRIPAGLFADQPVPFYHERQRRFLRETV
jgi:8-oxo-dGTP pyrophosphatase MutT (NUDIX family)